MKKKFSEVCDNLVCKSCGHTKNDHHSRPFSPNPDWIPDVHYIDISDISDIINNGTGNDYPNYPTADIILNNSVTLKDISFLLHDIVFLYRINNIKIDLFIESSTVNGGLLYREYIGRVNSRQSRSYNEGVGTDGYKLLKKLEKESTTIFDCDLDKYMPQTITTSKKILLSSFSDFVATDIYVFVNKNFIKSLNKIFPFPEEINRNIFDYCIG